MSVKCGTKAWKKCIKCVKLPQVKMWRPKKVTVSTIELIKWKRVFKSVFTFSHIRNVCVIVFFQTFDTVLAQKDFSRSRASFSMPRSWTVSNACCCVFCCLVNWPSSRSKSSVGSQKLKTESALHAPSLIRSPRMNLVRAASAANAPMSNKSSCSIVRFMVLRWASSASIFPRGCWWEEGFRIITQSVELKLGFINFFLETLLHLITLLSKWYCDSLNVMLFHLAWATLHCMRESFWVLSRRLAWTLSFLTSGSVGEEENSWTWLSVSEATTWYLKMKASARSNFRSCCLFTVENCMVFAVKIIPPMYGSFVVKKEDLWYFYWYVFHFCEGVLLSFVSDYFLGFSSREL